MTRTLRTLGLSGLLTATLTPAPAMRAAAPPQEPSAPTHQTSMFVGSDLYRRYCATCHGARARGDGPLAEMLKKRPPDLTQFARANNGTFPAEMVTRIVDGRKPVAGHGGADMPVWGDAFREAGGGLDEAAIKGRIDAIVRHLESIQEK